MHCLIDGKIVDALFQVVRWKESWYIALFDGCITGALMIIRC